MKIIDDNPLFSIKQDNLHREQLVDLVYRSLIDSTKENHTCRCIGIYGKWGEGKSSFMNFVKERIQQENLNKENDRKTDTDLKILLYDFNPWLANNDATLLWDFFNTISTNVSMEIKEKIAQYSGLVIEGANLAESVSKAAMGISPTLASVGLATKFFAKGIKKTWMSTNKVLGSLGNQTLSQRKNEITDKFRESGKHRFIFIDDIDRLDKEEIHTVFRLIREVADFDNVTYIVAMDPDIVAKSLGAYFGEGNISDGRDFIDKIIQVPIQLPVVHQLGLTANLKGKLKPLWDQYKCGNDEDLDKLCKDLSQLLTTQRQIIRFINQISFVFPALKDEVNMMDLCYLEAFKLIDIQAYLKLAHNQKALLKEVDSFELASNEEGEQKRVSKLYEDTLDDIVKNIESPKKKVLREFIDKLFTSKSISYQLDLDNKRICTGIYFAKYFVQDVPENIIPDRLIDNVYNQLSINKSDELTANFQEWYSSYGIKEVERALLSVTRRFHDASKRSEICQLLIKAVIHTDVSQNYGNTLIDIPNEFSIFVAERLFPVYVVNKIETRTDVVYDRSDACVFLSSIYEDLSIPLTFLLDLHARIDEKFNFKEFDFAISLVNRFMDLSYKEHQKYSKYKLRPIYKALAHIDEDRLDEYFDNAFESADFDMHRFLSCFIEEAEISKDVVAFVSTFGEVGLRYCKRLKENEDLTTEEVNKIASILSFYRNVQS